jgi:hypothetical protein
MRREKTGIGWKERKEEAERQSNKCGKNVVKWEREGGKGTERNTEWRRKGDRKNERDMEEEGKDREGDGWWGIGIKKVIFENFGIVILCLVMLMCTYLDKEKCLLFNFRNV